MSAESSAPRLLFLSQTLPFPPDGGVFIRTYNILRILARRYRIRLLAFDRTGVGSSRRDGSLQEAFAALGQFAELSVVPIPQDSSRLRFLTDHARALLANRAFTHYRYDEPSYSRLITAELASHVYDIIHVDSLDLARFLPQLPLDRVVLTHHNVESQLLRDRARIEGSSLLRRYIDRQAHLMESLERNWCPRVRLNVAVSARDARELRRIAPGARMSVVPNGVDVDRIRPTPESASDGSIVCVGGLAWFPNRDALDYLSTEVLPRARAAGLGDTRVVWVGRAPPGVAEEFARRFDVQLTGYVDDVMPFVERAACYVMPFRVGGGTRLKLLEAMAAAKPIVSTRVGAMGVEAADGRHLLLADEADDMADALVRVLADARLRKDLGSAARQLAVEVYSWDAIADSMLQTYGRMA